MKNITISDDLQKIGEEMNRQNNRSTQQPLFVVQEEVKIYTEDDADEFERVEEINAGDLCTPCLKKYESGEVLPDYCTNCDTGCFDGYKLEWQFNLRSGVFFTGKACDEHIAREGYHYRRARSFGISAYRNPEMNQVQRFLSSIASDDGKATENYL